MSWVKRNGVWQKPDLYTMLDIPCEGDNNSVLVKDRTGKTITLYNHAKLSTAQSRLGKTSLLLDGTDDYITEAYSGDFSLSTGDFTIDFWLYFNNLGTLPSPIMMGTGVAGGACHAAWGEYMSSATWYFDRFTLAEVQTTKSVNFASANTTGVWYHLAVVRNGNNLMFFKNGTQQGTSQDVTGVDYSTIEVTPLQMGLWRRGGGGATYEYLNGYLEAIRVSKGIARWTANFTPPTRKYL